MGKFFTGKIIWTEKQNMLKNKGQTNLLLNELKLVMKIEYNYQ